MTDIAQQTALPYTDEHEIFRTSARRFFEEECVPQQAAWRDAGMAPRSIWKRAGELGFLCPRVPEEYGGAGADFLFSVILLEEQARSGAVSPMLSLHSDVVAPYLVHYGTAEQKSHFLPRMTSGDYVGAIGMTEPSGGSDLKNLRTTARRDGDGYVINGQKTFISNGITANLLVLAAQTTKPDGGRSVSLFLVDTDEVKGFKRGRNLKKLGQKACDTAELFFEDMRVPEGALLGGTEGRGFAQLMNRLVEERLMTAVAAMGIVDHALAVTIDYVKERKAFGQRIIDFQNTRFKLAECKTEAKVLRVFLDHCIREFMAGELDAAMAAMLKYWATEQQVAIVDQCVQLHGGYGYILDYPIAQMWADGRIARIYGGANEVMKDIIGRTI
ncbi:MAG TPA: acyl-CoA dehydrogenase family protein [Rhizomicrobium sp.]|nr:acyl-CoA dehydrogenase family protein [Rhizomicrobium sp.]